MPVDTSIYSMIRPAQLKDPLEQYGRFAQVQNLVGAGQLQNLQRGELERSIAEEGKIRDLFSKGKPTPEQLMAVSPKRGLEYQKNLRETEKADVELKGAKTKLLREQTSYMRDKLASVVDQNGYNAWLEEGKRIFGPDIVASTPPQFSPDVQRQLLMDADGLLERLAPKPPAGHTSLPGGGLSPIDPNYLAGQKEIAEARRPVVNNNILPPQKTFENEDKLRSDYTANPIVKAATEMSTAFRMIESAYQRPSAANDLAMATKYMKILDPTSVVRESEFALAVNATGLMDKVQNYAASVLEGKKLNPTQRKDFYDSAKAINDAFRKQREQVDTEYSEMAKGYGLNPQNVIPSLRTKKPKTAAPVVPKPKESGAPGIKFLGYE